MINVSSAFLSFEHEGRRQPVLEDVSFSIQQEESCAIIGPSGSGKTSLLFLLAGILQPESGTIRINGNPKCGTILQNYGLFPWKRVSENIGLGLTLQKADKEKIKSVVQQQLEDMELTGFGDHFPGQLSGGMQQRVALARALAIEPEILFMDEPLSSLDALTRERLQNLILKIIRDKRITTVLVTHSIEEAVFLGTKIIILSKRPGRILKIVDNPGGADINYRQTGRFFQQCTRIRELLTGELNGQEA